jgi:hypothetical protein
MFSKICFHTCCNHSANPVEVSFLEFLKADIAGSYSPPQNVYLQRDRVFQFLTTPFMVEKVIISKTPIIVDFLTKTFLFFSQS